mgnify:CR=1 FL=1
MRRRLRRLAPAPLLGLCLLGGLLCLSGMVLMAINLARTFALAKVMPAIVPPAADAATPPPAAPAPALV